MSCDIGVIGLSVMGQNLALNIASKGFNCACWNRTYSKTEDTAERAKKEGNLPIHCSKELNDFVNSLKTPKCVIIMVQAGKPVDLVLESLVPLLKEGDAIIDGGNEWFRLTESRLQQMATKKIHYLGMGVSGGEEGARHGPALMPGGSLECYKLVEPILKKISAKSAFGDCVDYIGKMGSGNYVKMVHNGIEYGDMQLISETYNILRHLGYTNKEMSEIFKKWNTGILKSYLIEITTTILTTPDDLSPNQALVDVISDVARSKGTGKWTVQEGANNGIPISVIESALYSRNLSALTDIRALTQKCFVGTEKELRKYDETEKNKIVEKLEMALYCAKIISYTQGLHLIHAMSKAENWDISISKIARIWTGGCIIRAELLREIEISFNKKENEQSLLICHEYFQKQLQNNIQNLRSVCSFGLENAIPLPAFLSAISYVDSLKSKRLPTCLIQAQRDFFGAHEYERIDRAGTFHYNWLGN